MAFQFSIERASTSNQPAVVRLTGRFTLGLQLSEFRGTISELITDGTAKGILLDLAEVQDLDSAGLGEIFFLYSSAGKHGHRLCLLDPGPRVIRVLETTRLSAILPHFTDEAAAKSWLSDIGLGDTEQAGAIK